jgi:hypothetical protein
LQFYQRAVKKMEIITISDRFKNQLEWFYKEYFLRDGKNCWATPEDEANYNKMKSRQSQLEDIQKLPIETILRDYPFAPILSCDECEKPQIKVARFKDKVEHPYGDSMDVCAECLKRALYVFEGK